MLPGASDIERPVRVGFVVIEVSDVAQPHHPFRLPNHPPVHLHRALVLETHAERVGGEALALAPVQERGALVAKITADDRSARLEALVLKEQPPVVCHHARGQPIVDEVAQVTLLPVPPLLRVDTVAAARRLCDCRGVGGGGSGWRRRGWRQRRLGRVGRGRGGGGRGRRAGRVVSESLGAHLVLLPGPGALEGRGGFEVGGRHACRVGTGTAPWHRAPCTCGDATLNGAT
mmetsp:Transcript_91580/g.261753  ORF Transcript_91580/g.261753 Transcript_91580/m.261753 type:complete len:231 (+) Transcript_91580:847-1539(+)